MQNVQTTLLTIFIIVYSIFGLTSTSSAAFSAFRSGRQHRARNSAATTSMGRNERIGRIMHGFPTRDGEFGWQASLELLHPSLGFIGHWCGGVLIHKYWILSSAHCVHNDLFNLPLPALWTVVLGENNRKIETGYEQRIPVDRIVMHEKYRQFKNDLVLMKLTRPANLTPKSKVRTIFLPSSSHIRINANYNVSPAYIETTTRPPPKRNNNHPNDDDLMNFDRNENYLRNLQESPTGIAVNSIIDKIRKVNRNEIVKRESKIKSRLDDEEKITKFNNVTLNRTTKRHRRRNDKFLHRRPTNPEDYELFMNLKDNKKQQQQLRQPLVDYHDCVSVGWGKWMEKGDLSDTLLKIDVPIHNINRCEEVYSNYVSLNNAQHLCAGRLDGSGGSCIGDSGGGLQCKLDKNGPWILVGITSFGSGCAKAGYADVFTNVAYYRNWIDNVIRNN